MENTQAPKQPLANVEDVTTVGGLVAEFLDARIDPDIPPELRDVVRLRAATRRVLEARLPPEDEDRLFGGLARQAARSLLPLWSLAAMEAEILEPEQLELLPRDVVARARALRRWGHSACPTCHLQLITEFDTERDDRRREWAKEDEKVRHLAIPEEFAS